jgi:hypothetical protein
MDEIDRIQLILEGRCIECYNYNTGHADSCSHHPYAALFESFARFQKSLDTWSITNKPGFEYNQDLTDPYADTITFHQPLVNTWKLEE